MATFDDIAMLSALPIVNLKDVSVPKDGLFLQLNKFCKKSFQKNGLCAKHYESMSQYEKNEPLFVQCPQGFCSVALAVGHLRFALTAFIPFPRIGGDHECQRAKQVSESKIPKENILSVLTALTMTYAKLDRLQEETIKNESMALHEIRKLNRNVKQTAERLYNKLKNEELLQILKTSELMSKQFDVIEILANESLAELTPNTVTEIYRIFDKCVHIYQTPDKRIDLWCKPGYSPKAHVSDKTFPIIPTVLIENALKYSPSGSGIGITIEPEEDECVIKVANVAIPGQKLDSSIFRRGVRGQTDTDGSGNGLYIASLIAKQHQAKLSVICSEDPKGQNRCTFTFRIKSIDGVVKQ